MRLIDMDSPRPQISQPIACKVCGGNSTIETSANLHFCTECYAAVMDFVAVYDHLPNDYTLLLEWHKSFFIETTSEEEQNV